jgi:protein KRI1
VEILLSTDIELNALASVKHLAPYRRQGLGRAGMGLNKRVYDLKKELKSRKWGEEDGEGGERKVGSGANDVKLGNGEGRKGKRLGKKERMKRKVEGVAEGDAPEDGGDGSAGAGQKRGNEAVEGNAEGDGEAKKKRRKKKKNAGENSEAVLAIHD